jgi:ATP-dependent exoDNAse (exonuclease V) beta subunit
MSKFSLHGTKYINEEGKRVPSVTTIISQHLGWNKNALIAWTKRMMLGGQDSDKVLSEAGDIGTLLHLLIEGHQQGFDVDTKDYSYNQEKAAMKAFAGYLQWYEKRKFKSLRNELVLVNEEMQVGGTIDSIGKMGDDLVVVDWKTSKYLYAENKLQLAAYTYMFEQAQPKANVAYGLVMRFGKDDGKFHQHVIKREKLETGIEIFKALVKISQLKSQL